MKGYRLFFLCMILLLASACTGIPEINVNTPPRAVPATALPGAPVLTVEPADPVAAPEETAAATDEPAAASPTMEAFPPPALDNEPLDIRLAKTFESRDFDNRTGSGTLEGWLQKSWFVTDL